MYENNLAVNGSARCVTYDEINTISATDNLRAIGIRYSLPKCGIQTSYGNDGLGYVDESGSISDWVSCDYGIRPVVSLKSNVLALSTTSGDSHNTPNTAWHLTINE